MGKEIKTTEKSTQAREKMEGELWSVCGDEY
jgi:hypothetical protein